MIFLLIVIKINLIILIFCLFISNNGTLVCGLVEKLLKLDVKITKAA